MMETNKQIDWQAIRRKQKARNDEADMLQGAITGLIEHDAKYTNSADIYRALRDIREIDNRIQLDVIAMALERFTTDEVATLLLLIAKTCKRNRR